MDSIDQNMSELLTIIPVLFWSFRVIILHRAEMDADRSHEIRRAIKALSDTNDAEDAGDKN